MPLLPGGKEDGERVAMIVRKAERLQTMACESKAVFDFLAILIWNVSFLLEFY